MCEERPATTVFAFPVCDECAEWLGKLDVQLKAEEAADPELARLGREVEESATAFFDVLRRQSTRETN